MGFQLILLSGQDKTGIEGYLMDLLAGLQSPEEVLMGRITASAMNRESWSTALIEMSTPPMPFVPNPTKVVVLRDIQVIKTMDVSFELEKSIQAAEAWSRSGDAGRLVLIAVGNEKADQLSPALEPISKRLKSKDQHKIFKVFSLWQQEAARKEIKEVLSEFGVELKSRLINVIYELVEGNVSLVRPLAEKLALVQAKGTKVTSKLMRDLMGVRQYVSMPAVAEAIHQVDRAELLRALSGVLMTMSPWEAASKLGGLLHKDALYSVVMNELTDIQSGRLLGFKEGGHKRLYYWRRRHEQLPAHYYLDIIQATVDFRYRVTEGELRGDLEQRKALVSSLLSVVPV